MLDKKIGGGLNSDPNVEKFEIVPADEGMGTKNCIIIKSIENIDVSDITRIAIQNEAFNENIPDTPDNFYADYVVQFPGRKQERLTINGLKASLLKSPDQVEKIFDNFGVPLTIESFGYHYERARVISNEQMQNGWIDQDEVDRIMAIAYENPVTAENCCEERRSNYVSLNDLVGQGIITRETADELMKIDPFKATELIIEYRKQGKKKSGIESNEHELNPEELGSKFNSMDAYDFIDLLRDKIRSNPSLHFSIIANWVNVQKARAAKGLLEQHGSRLNIDSITIRATREQYEEDINAFQSGVQWEEIQNLI
ncbi:MAG: hypothetical protein WCT33_02800 [Patescibacteria group bacterium]|jgi:hypothetical protein